MGNVFASKSHVHSIPQVTGLQDALNVRQIDLETVTNIELGNRVTPSSSRVSYIDFHSGAYNPDYSARIIASGGTNDSGSALLSIYGGEIRLQTTHGYTIIGPQNTEFSHFATDRAQFHFNKPIRVQGDIFSGPSSDTRVLNLSDIDINPSGRKVVQRDDNGDVIARLHRSTYASTNPTVNFIMTQIGNGADTNNYLRPSTPSQVAAALSPHLVQRSGGNEFKLHANWSLEGLYVYNGNTPYAICSSYNWASFANLMANGGAVRDMIESRAQAWAVQEANRVSSPPYTGTTPTETNFPLRHTIICELVGGGSNGSFLNQNVVPRVSTVNTSDYTTSTASSSALAGIWRRRGTFSAVQNSQSQIKTFAILERVG